MSDDYLLSSFEVTELLCRVVTKRNNELSSEENSTSTQIQKLKTPNPVELSKVLEICDQDYAESFSQNVLTPQGKAKAGKSKSPRLLYFMMLASKRGLPYFISENELFSLLRYLEIDPEKFNPYVPIEPMKLSKRLIDFEGGCWILYYPSQDTDQNPRLGCSILEFLPFGRVRLKAAHQAYSGHYHFYGRDEYYIQMHLKTIPYRTRNLNILVYCGDSQPEIMIGQYNNVEQKISAGKAILIRSSKKYDDLIANHLNQNSEDFLSVNEYIRRYLINQDNKQIITPTEITVFSLFERYVKSTIKI